MKTARVLLAVAALFLSAAGDEPVEGGAPDWPAYLGGMARSGSYAGSLALPVSHAWKQDLACSLSVSPVVAHRRIYAADDCGRTYCLDLDRGVLVWATDPDEKISASPLYSGGALFIGTVSGDLKALDCTTGVTLWSARAARGPLSAAVAFEDKVIAAAGLPDNAIMAFRAKDGRLLWKTALPGPVTSPPCLKEKKLVCGLGPAAAVAINPENGVILWKKECGGPFERSAVTLLGNEVLCLPSGKAVGLFKFDLETGSQTGGLVFPLEQEGPDPAAGLLVSAPAVSSNVCCFIMGQKGFPLSLYTLKAVRLPDLSPLWKRSKSVPARDPESCFPPLLWNDKVIACLGDNGLLVADTATGETLFSCSFKSRLAAPPALYDNAVVVVTVKGACHVFKSAGSAFMPEALDVSADPSGGQDPFIVIKYQVPRPCRLKLAVFNMRGQEVMTLINGQRPAGYFKLLWNGRGRSKRPLAGGVYFVKIATEGASKIVKMTILK